MIVKGTTMGPAVVSFALEGAETIVLASFASGILHIVHAIFSNQLNLLAADFQS